MTETEMIAILSIFLYSRMLPLRMQPPKLSEHVKARFGSS